MGVETSTPEIRRKLPELAERRLQRAAGDPEIVRGSDQRNASVGEQHGDVIIQEKA
jgi:hypothetical protein